MARPPVFPTFIEQNSKTLQIPSGIVATAKQCLKETVLILKILQVRPRSSLSWTTRFCAKATSAEFLVLCDFVKQSGILEVFVGDPTSTCVSFGSGKRTE